MPPFHSEEFKVFSFIVCVPGPSSAFHVKLTSKIFCIHLLVLLSELLSSWGFLETNLTCLGDPLRWPFLIAAAYGVSFGYNRSGSYEECLLHPYAYSCANTQIFTNVRGIFKSALAYSSYSSPFIWGNYQELFHRPIPLPIPISSSWGTNSSAGISAFYFF